MIYELRTYQAGGGRMAEMEKVMASDCTAILQRAKVPRPLGAWHAVAGPRLPAFVWILGWHFVILRLNLKWVAAYFPTAKLEDASRSALKQLVRTFFNDSPGSAMAALMDLSDGPLSDDEYGRLAALLKRGREHGEKS